MNRRSLALISAAALILQSCLPSVPMLPQSPALRWLERKSGRIAYVGTDGNVRTIDQAGGGVQQVTGDAVLSHGLSVESFYYQYPTWSPDGRALAFVGVHRAQDAPRGFGIWTANAGGVIRGDAGGVIRGKAAGRRAGAGLPERFVSPAAPVVDARFLTDRFPCNDPGRSPGPRHRCGGRRIPAHSEDRDRLCMAMGPVH